MSANWFGTSTSIVGVADANVRRHGQVALACVQDLPTVNIPFSEVMVSAVNQPYTAVASLEFSTSIEILSSTNMLGGNPLSELITQRVFDLQTLSGLDGVVSHMNQKGLGVISVETAKGSAKIQWQGHGAGEPIPRTLLGSTSVDLKHEQGSSSGVLKLDVNFPAMEDGEARLHIENVMDSLIPSIPAIDAGNFLHRYRCIFIANTNPDNDFSKVTLSIATQPTSGIEVYLGFDPAGVNSSAQLLAAHSDIPAGVTFTQAVSTPLASGDYIAVWVKEYAEAGALRAKDNDMLRFNIEAEL